MGGIFVSHTHDDQPIAAALATLVDRLYGKSVQVHYSTKKELAGGIAPGRDWFRWIIDQVRETDVAVIIMTPGSIQKPWVFWEAGAVSGAALSISEDEGRVCPLSFGVKAEQVPSPFARLQIVRGTDMQEMQTFVADLHNRFGSGLPPAEAFQVGAKAPGVVSEFIAKISDILLKLPHAVTEAAIQEWLARLDELQKEKRFSETVVIEDWLNVAFGRDSENQQRPLDLRIHRRLGELYATAGQQAAAARQFELGRQLAPRDIFLLRRLGKAYLDLDQPAKAGAVLEDMESLDPSAFKRNSENAALKARWYEKSGDVLAARDLLQSVYTANPSAYYLGDRLGQMYLKSDNLERAREIYAQVRNNMRKLREKNVWTHATALTAAIVLNDQSEIRQAIEDLRGASPSVEEMDSIERGVQQVIQIAGGDPGILAALRGIEQRRATS
jgi:tetratricopeptide (TPR) repeat protein